MVRGGRYAALLAATLAAAGCSSEEPSDPATPCTDCDPPKTICPEGFRALSDDAGCEPIFAMDCAPGSMPTLGSETCAPAGWIECPDGFEPDRSGWGCRAIVPTQPCEGATLEVLGSAECQPIGDCGAKFPPDDASVFVDPSFAPGELDETHFTTIGAALAAAPSGAVIAITDGVYAETLDVKRPLTLVGRCAGQVIVENPGTDSPGLRALGVEDVVVRGMTFRGHPIGAGVQDGSLTLIEVLLEDNSTSGLLAAGDGALLTATRTVVRGTKVGADGYPPWGVGAQQGGRVVVSSSSLASNTYANLVALREGASARVERSVVRDALVQERGTAPGTGGIGLYVYEGGTLELAESVLVDNRGAGMVITKTGRSGAPASATVARSEIRGGEGGGRDKTRGIEVSREARLEASDCLVTSSEEAEVVLVDQGSARLERCTLLGREPDDAATSGPGLLVAGASHAELVGCALVRNREGAIVLQEESEVLARATLLLDPMPSGATDIGTASLGLGASVSSSRLGLDGSAIVSARICGIVAGHPTAEVALTRALIATVTGTDAGLFGRGIDAHEGAKVTMSGSAVVDCREAGMVIGLPGAQATIDDSSIGPTSLDGSGFFGHGLVVAEGALVTTRRTTLRGSAGVGLAVAGGGAFVTSSFISSNVVGVHAQTGSTLQEGDEPSADPLAVVVSGDTRFVGNTTRVGNGQVAIPQMFGPAAP